MKSENILSRFKPADLFLLFLLTIISVSGFFFVKEVMPQGNEVVIEVKGKQVYRLSLDENTVKEVSGPHGVTIIEIKDRKVRVKDSPCENKLCIRQGWISSGAIVCLPNRVVVTVGKGITPAGKLDAITG